MGLETDTIIKTLSCFSKTALPQNLIDNLINFTRTYGKVKIVLNDQKYYIESPLTDVLDKLLANPVIKSACVSADYIESDKMVRHTLQCFA